MHDRSLSWLGTGTSIISGGVKLVLWALQVSVCFNIYNTVTSLSNAVCL